MPKYAHVIINSPSRELDKTFTYLIPEKFYNILDIGYRVLIPFGGGNTKIEGYVVGLSEETQLNNVKEIYDVIDNYPIFSENILHLAEWMRKEYMCTMLDCLKTIAPTGIGIKPIKIIVLNNIEIPKFKGEVQNQIVQFLKEHGGRLEYFELLQKVNRSSFNSALKNLTDSGIVSVEFNLSSGVKDKKIKVALLNVSPAEAQIYADKLPEKSYAQKKAIEILCDNDYISVSDLVKFSEISYQSLNSLNKKEIIAFDEIEVSRDPYGHIKYEPSSPHILTDEQNYAVSRIIGSLDTGIWGKFLLHGITGSGKTEIYLQTIDYAIKKDGQAIVLVPEISLTPQMVERFKSRFGEQVAVMHSRLSLGERFDQWKKIKHGEVKVVVGARSAIFAPFEKLKLIIIDEEHETSYKSENRPKYDAKTIAEKRSELEGCSVILGSATPSINTYYQGQTGKYEIIELKNRVNRFVLPKVEVIDMRLELQEGNRSILSRSLYNEILENINRNEQTILFLNRRGYSTFVSCRSCGYVMKCPDCSISLTYHSYNNMLMCHYCGYTMRNPSLCPSCSSKYIKYFGIGTQKVEEEIKKLFPSATVLRMDVDTTSTKFSHQRILDKFKNDNINILIGTQMIAKGLDFPNVTLVGVISADISLNIDDYKSSERTFQLLTQVAGRSGRGEKPGRVVIQTYQPDDFSIITSKQHDYHTFYSKELGIRKSLNYPPFTNLISIILSNPRGDLAKKVSYEWSEKIKQELSKTNLDYEMFSPAPAPIPKIKDSYRWRILIKIYDTEELKAILQELENSYYNEIDINIDIEKGAM